MNPKRPLSLRSPARSSFRLALHRAFAPGILLLAGFALGASSPAAADDEEDPYAYYFEFQAGVSFIPNQTLRDGATGQSRFEPNTDADEQAFNVGGAFGREILDLDVAELRAELAVNYRETGIDKAAVVAPALVTDGDVSLLAVMANGYADFDLGIGVIPYVGAGLGYGEYKIDIRQNAPGTLIIDDADSVFVYNVMVGARVPVSRVAEFSAGYRYVSALGTENFEATIATVTQEIEAEFDAHELVFGLRFNF